MLVGCEVGILRCVADDDTRVTFAGGADATRLVVAQKDASLPNGVAISKNDFPVMLNGWPHRLRNPPR